MKKIVIYSCILLFTISSQGQNHITHWFFGFGAGLIFDSQEGTVTATNLAENTIKMQEGCATMTNPDGILQFYTDGRTVWNRNHEPMPNANYSKDPESSLKGDPSSTTSAIIVPKPFSNEYYVFTVDEPHHQNAQVYPNQFDGEYHPEMLEGNPNRGFVPDIDDGYNNGLNYSLVDMDLNGGLGDVVPGVKNVHLVTYDANNIEEEKYKCSEKIVAIQDEDCMTGFWVITHFINKFYAFRVDENGVSHNPVISETSTSIGIDGYRRNAIGYLKATIAGNKLAITHGQNGEETGGVTENSGAILVYDFDKVTGKVSNEVVLKDKVNGYGIEFSSDGTKVYATYNEGIASRSLSQFDLGNDNSEVEVGKARYALQLGPDGRIYAAKDDATTIHVINEPNKVGEECDYQTSAIELAEGTTCQLGLPSYGVVSDCSLSNDTAVVESDFFNMYPNPTSGEITIRLNKLKKQLELNVLDIRGNVLMSKKIEPNKYNFKLDISSFSDGIYLLNITGGNLNIYKKIIKK